MVKHTTATEDGWAKKGVVWSGGGEEMCSYTVTHHHADCLATGGSGRQPSNNCPNSTEPRHRSCTKIKAISLSWVTAEPAADTQSAGKAAVLREDENHHSLPLILHDGMHSSWRAGIIDSWGEKLMEPTAVWAGRCITCTFPELPWVEQLSLPFYCIFGQIWQHCGSIWSFRSWLTAIFWWTRNTLHFVCVMVASKWNSILCSLPPADTEHWNSWKDSALLRLLPEQSCGHWNHRKHSYRGYGFKAAGP